MRGVKWVGLLLLLVLPACAGRPERAQLLGSWESTDAKKSASLEFLKDGTVLLGGKADALLEGKVVRMLRDFNIRPAANSFTFEVVDAQHVAIQGDFTKLAAKLADGGRSGGAPAVDMQQFRPRTVLTMTLAGDELTLTSPNGQALTFRRSG